MSEIPVPSRQDRTVAIWLFCLSGLVFALVVRGGVTRRTGSGLSMVDWKPLTGALPPLSEADWQRLFDMYRQSPEFQKVNSHMDVHAFKGIFWLEYLHRVLGRIIGIAFLLPFVFFAARGYIGLKQWPKYLLMFLLGGLQGLLGWYMVKSGLVDVPHVSQYRLTAHLVAAFLIYSYLFWVALSLLYPGRGDSVRPWFGRSIALTAMVCLTVFSGGFVAGLDAGKIYNTFPTMGGHWLPPGLYALDPFWRNLFENTTTVQFNHRLLAIATFCVIVLFWLGARRADLPARARLGINAVLHAAALQMGLGISTLLLAVPVSLGAAHQAAALLLLTACLLVVHSLRPAPQSQRLRQSDLQPALDEARATGGSRVTE